MRHPEVLAIPVLMVCDYYLTILGSVYSKRKYAEHFVNETYELNPVWRKDVDNIKWFNYKHLLGVAISTIFFLFFAEWQTTLNRYFIESFIGYFLILYGLIIGRHLSNILIFTWLIKHPYELAGKVEMSHGFALKISQHHVLILAVPLLILAILKPNGYIIGGLISCLSFYFTSYRWINKEKAKRAQQRYLLKQQSNSGT